MNDQPTEKEANTFPESEKPEARKAWSAPSLVHFSATDITQSSTGPNNDGFGGSTAAS
jgi:hypothetical protein